MTLEESWKCGLQHQIKIRVYAVVKAPQVVHTDNNNIENRAEGSLINLLLN